MTLTTPFKVLSISMLLAVFMPVSAWAEQTITVALKTKAGGHDQPYFVVMLLDEQGRYNKTLTVVGDDPQYYRAFKFWKRYIGRTDEDIDALSSASVSNGTTVKRTVKIPHEAIAKNYTVRVDAAGYRGEKYIKTAMIKLSPENKEKRFNGQKFLDYAWVSW